MMLEPHPSLPDSYMQFAHRGYGMDQRWYEWSMLHQREPVRWPDGARVAVWVNVALEFFPLDQPAQPFKAPGGMVTPYPDLRHYTLRDYGNRVGVFRVFRLLDGLGMKPSVSFNSKVAERYPRLMDEVVSRGWEVVANGVDMGRLHHGGLDADTEAAMIDESLDGLRSMSGQPVTGWLSPARSESGNTLDLLAARGVDYVCDWYNDDMPFPMTTANGVLHAMPLSHELDDQTVQLHYQQSEHSFVDQVSDAMAVAHRESSTDDGRILSLTIHPWMSGQPHRIGALGRALENLASYDRVWMASGADILAAFTTR
jgi:peptidoglycan/xylan/chitin deacetylase (PgdA/CDA1 family)